MATSGSRGADRAVNQDYIARIRYSNALPPPPNPPKLLDIPNTGLSSGQYTNPGFASRLAREQPLNIEADAELGMPIDLVGMPGIFDGDESSIFAPLQAPIPHPRDRALLRPLGSLGKAKTSEAGVSFLRRTEYISAYTGGGRARPNASLLSVNTNRVKKLPTDVDKNSDEYIKAKVERTFQITQSRLQNKSTIKHPKKRNVRLVSALPLLPDPQSISDYGGYVNVKFSGYPIPAGTKYDPRLESAIIRAIAASDEQTAAHEEAMRLHEQEPDRYPAPTPSQDYELFLTETAYDAKNFKRKFDENDQDKDSEDLYTFTNEAGNKVFRYNRVRDYETEKTIDQFNPSARYSGKDCELFLVESDGRDNKRQKAMHYYPMIQKQHIRPQRKKQMDQKKYGYNEEDEITTVDHIDVTIRDPNESELESRNLWAQNPLHVEKAIEEGEEEAIPEEAENGVLVDENGESTNNATADDVDADADADADVYVDADADEDQIIATNGNGADAVENGSDESLE